MSGTDVDLQNRNDRQQSNILPESQKGVHLPFNSTRVRAIPMTCSGWLSETRSMPRQTIGNGDCRPMRLILAFGVLMPTLAHL
jgi:hypothetical protein